MFSVIHGGWHINLLCLYFWAPKWRKLLCRDIKLLSNLKFFCSKHGRFLTWKFSFYIKRPKIWGEGWNKLNEQMGKRQFLDSSSGFGESGRESLWFLRKKTLDTSSKVSWDEKLQALDGSWLFWFFISHVEFCVIKENIVTFYLFTYLLCSGRAVLDVINDCIQPS